MRFHFNSVVATTALSVAAFSSLPSSLSYASQRILKKSKNSKSSSSSSDDGDDIFDTVVVGSGLAGLIAARELEKNDLDVKVLEAMERVGGRMVKKDLTPTQAIDFGGQWIGKTHFKLQNLVEELGLNKFLDPVVANGEYATIIFRNKKYSYFEATDNIDFRQCTEAYQSLAQSLPDNTYPYDFEDEALLKLDDVTSKEFIYNITNDTIGRFACLTSLGPRLTGWFPGEADTVSLLANVFSLKNGNGNTAETNQNQWLIEGGAGQIPLILAGDLEHPVALGDPVVGITQKYTSDGQIVATIRTLLGKEYKARNVIVATSPYISGQIHYQPSLSWDRHQLNQHKPMGTVAKILIEFPEKIWDGAGDVLTSPDDGFLSLCSDMTDPRSDRALLGCIITGKQYDQFAAFDSFEKRKEAVLYELKEKYEDARALSPISFDVGDWPANPHIQGCYAAYWPPQTWTRFGRALLKPEGVIQWCSTEYALEWSGWFEGSIESGLTAAKNVLEGNTGQLVPKIPSGDYTDRDSVGDYTDRLNAMKTTHPTDRFSKSEKYLKMIVSLP